MTEAVAMFDQVIETTEAQLEGAKKVVESLKNVIVGSNTVVMMADSSGGSAYLRILKRNEEAGTVEFNFSGNIVTTPRYTPERAQEVIDAYSTDKRPLKKGNLLMCAKADVETLTQSLEEFRQARENFKED
ncbi:hypothetical protein [Vibrio crassostreae]|uniref:hypothetical protein n=1 Tax=Vibrio crassostreae TaxID=246167 RepID=UPI001B30D3C9|nr:hypothetical protein [Vibrio crassostreae]